MQVQSQEGMENSPFSRAGLGDHPLWDAVGRAFVSRQNSALASISVCEHLLEVQHWQIAPEHHVLRILYFMQVTPNLRGWVIYFSLSMKAFTPLQEQERDFLPPALQSSCMR